MPRAAMVLSVPLLALAGPARAQLADPTKPPAALAAPAAEQASGTAPALTGLQSVILRKNGKPAALINGEVIELGGKLGEATLVRISEDAVVLRGPDGEETLRLTPAAEKKVGAGATAKKPPPEAGRRKNKEAEHKEAENRGAEK